MRILPFCSLLCRSVNHTLKGFAAGTKFSQILSSSALLSWRESARLHLIQSTYSNVHRFKIHLTVSQSMSASLLGCLSLPWKITFLLKKERRPCVRDQSVTKFSWVAPKLMIIEGQQENGVNVMDDGRADEHGQREKIISMLVTGRPCSHISKCLHGRARHGNPAARPFTR